MANTLPTTMEYFDNLLGEQLTEGGGSGGGGSSDLVPLEFQYVPKIRGYESVKTLGEIIADADSMNQCITFTSEYFSEGIPVGYTEGSTYRLIYADSVDNTADVRFVPTDRVYHAKEISITGSGSNTFPLSIVGK